jgi:thiosulfate/3-mercaptopyruvate sulfurtransferase
MSRSSPEQAPVPPIVDASWLREHLRTDPTITICHVGSTMSGSEPEQDFERRHLPGARFVSLDDALAAKPGGTDGRHPLPSPADFARALGDLGVGEEATVVAYDERGGALAGRMVWMLRILGQRAALLDGGIAAWVAESSDDLEHGPIRATPIERPVHDWPPDAIADATAVVEHVRAGGVVVDSRDHARYVGEIEPIDPVAGHVPGAVNLPFTENLGSDGRFRPRDELHRRFASVIGGDDRPIVYCGSGVTACHNALAMEHAGLGLPRVFVASWSGWTADSERPIATGATP